MMTLHTSTERGLAGVLAGTLRDNWAELPATGSVFAFSLPYRRVQTSDAA